MIDPIYLLKTVNGLCKKAKNLAACKDNISSSEYQSELVDMNNRIIHLKEMIENHLSNDPEILQVSNELSLMAQNLCDSQC